MNVYKQPNNHFLLLDGMVTVADLETDNPYCSVIANTRNDSSWRGVLSCDLISIGMMYSGAIPLVMTPLVLHGALPDVTNYETDAVAAGDPCPTQGSIYFICL